MMTNSSVAVMTPLFEFGKFEIVYIAYVCMYLSAGILIIGLVNVY